MSILLSHGPSDLRGELNIYKPACDQNGKFVLIEILVTGSWGALMTTWEEGLMHCADSVPAMRE